MPLRSTRSCFCTLLWQSLVVYLLGAFMLAGAARAHDHILATAYWTDPTGTATFEQAREASYIDYTGVLSQGFGKQAQWIRIKIGASSHAGSDALVLRIRPVFLDEITLYDPVDLAKGRAPRRTGDSTLFSASEFESLNHSFLIPAQPAPREVWLRLVTTSTQLMHVEALAPREMLREEQSLGLVYAGLLAVILSCLIWVLLAWLRDRDQVNGLFVLRQTVLFLYTACFLGYHRIVLSGHVTPDTQDALYSWLVLLTSGLSCLFEYRFLSEYAMPRWAHWLMRALLACSVVAMTLMVLGQEHASLQLNTLYVGVILISLLLVALCVKPRAPSGEQPSAYVLPRAALVSYYALILAVLGLSILPSLGVEMLRGSTLSIYGVMLYGVSSGVLMSILLVARSRQMERIRQEVANSLLLSREQLTLEQRRRQDQSQLLNMLMHELKTPLAVIDLALQNREMDNRIQGYVGRAIDNMKGILERCVQTDRLVERPFEVQPRAFDLAQQLRQWVQDKQQAEGRIRLQTPATAPVHSDLQCVQIIASNLIENALKYGDTGEPVEVTLSPEVHPDGRAGLRLRVCNVPGLAGHPEADKVFAKYYRSAGAQRHSGTGLGLFLSHNLARQIAAELRYLPNDTQICFELWLPN